jgi:hypothetical protein
MTTDVGTRVLITNSEVNKDEMNGQMMICDLPPGLPR